MLAVDGPLAMFGIAMSNPTNKPSITLTVANAAFDAALAASEAAEMTFKSSHLEYTAAMRAMLAAKVKRAADKRAFLSAEKVTQRTAGIAYEAHIRALNAAR